MGKSERRKTEDFNGWALERAAEVVGFAVIALGFLSNLKLGRWLTAGFFAAFALLMWRAQWGRKGWPKWANFLALSVFAALVAGMIAEVFWKTRVFG
jgi:hypothetical protein